jgi:hypothetical protein
MSFPVEVDFDEVQSNLDGHVDAVSGRLYCRTRLRRTPGGHEETATFHSRQGLHLAKHTATCEACTSSGIPFTIGKQDTMSHAIHWPSAPRCGNKSKPLLGLQSFSVLILLFGRTA